MMNFIFEPASKEKLGITIFHDNSALIDVKNSFLQIFIWILKHAKLSLSVFLPDIHQNWITDSSTTNVNK